MSTTTSRCGPPKKISSCVRPGVLDVRASARRPVSALISDDLPTLERPAKAISGPAIGGSDSGELAAEAKFQSPAKSRRPASISALEKPSIRPADFIVTPLSRHAAARGRNQVGYTRFLNGPGGRG